MSDIVPASGWYEAPADTRRERFWDGQSWTDQIRSARRLRDFGSLLAAVVAVIRYRGGVVVALAGSGWLVMALLSMPVLLAVMDYGVASRVSDMWTAAATAGTQESIDEAVDLTQAVVSDGSLFPLGVGAVAGGMALIFVLYLVAVTFVTTSISLVAYRWLATGDRVRLVHAVVHAARRLAAGVTILVGWLAAAGVAVIVPAAGAAWLGSQISTALGVLGGFAGLGLGIGILVALFSHWSLTGQAVALSDAPWNAFAQSSRVTRNYRWAVVWRIVVVAVLAVVVATVVAFPLLLLEAAIGAVSSLTVVMLVFFAVRVAESIVNTSLVAAAGACIYTDLASDDLSLDSA